MRRKLGWLVLSLLVALAWGCSKKESSTTGTTTGGKLDCPDCDPKGPNAFVQTGLGDQFYTTGETFKVAFRRLEQNFLTNRESLSNEPGVKLLANVSSEIHLFSYKVVGLRKQDINNVLRDVVKLEITQATPPANLGFSNERVDGFEKKLELEMDDLLYLVSVTRYTRTYPLGLTVAAGTNQPVNLPGSVFPAFVPDASVAGVERSGGDIPLDTAFKPIADNMQPGWSSKSYLYFELGTNEIVFWQKGHKWPFYIRNNHGETLLVEHGWN
ncbi:MAG: hypothetical protein KC609_14595 [Myxococcales bacterium]|nr:hypothetical protein [Myxococcales bacterium]